MMTITGETPSYYVSVEDFIPNKYVNEMRTLIENVENLDPVQTQHNFEDLKRAMTWMTKYISPTSEFWEWTSDTIDLDGSTNFNVQLLGFGWAVSVSSKHKVSEADVSGEEKRLIGLLNSITSHIPVEAVIRMKMSDWTKGQVEECSKALCYNGFPCSVVSKKAFRFPDLDLVISTEPEERLLCKKVTREKAKKIEKILSYIKQYANKWDEGAGWCAYQRRRLTVLHKVGTNALSPFDIRFIENPEYGMKGEVLASNITSSGVELGVFCFMRAKYHVGNFHPRGIIATVNENLTIKDLLNYIYYLWNSNYSRIWLYLNFEDAYAYADRLFRFGQYVDPEIWRYWRNIVKTDDILTEMHALRRIDAGEFQSYQPPHGAYKEERLLSDNFSNRETPIYWIRHHLIEASTTQLYEDPLKNAIKQLEHMDQHMRSALNLFVQTIDIKMQKSIQILQILFVVAAIGQVILIINLGSVVVEMEDNFLSQFPGLVAWLESIGISYPLSGSSLLLSFTYLFLLIVLSTITIFLFRSRRVRKYLDVLMPNQ